MIQLLLAAIGSFFIVYAIQFHRKAIGKPISRWFMGLCGLIVLGVAFGPLERKWPLWVWLSTPAAIIFGGAMAWIRLERWERPKEKVS